jgi:hypothetical protein
VPNLEKTESAEPFTYDRAPQTNEDTSYWGLAGIFLAVPAVLAGLTVKGLAPWARVFALSAIVAFLVVAFVVDYNRFQGRRTIVIAFWAVLCLAATVERLVRQGARSDSAFVRAARVFLLAGVILTCLTAISTVVFREDSALYPRDPNSLWKVANVRVTGVGAELDRIGLLTRRRSEMYEPLLAYESRVPPMATVATILPPDSYEYPLFGMGLTRTILPLNSFVRGRRDVPEEADFLLFARGLVETRPGDIYLGEEWYLRSLDNSTR